MTSNFVLGLKKSSTSPTLERSLYWQARGGWVKTQPCLRFFLACGLAREGARLGARGEGGCYG
jgi:hypothetical protein